MFEALQKEALALYNKNNYSDYGILRDCTDIGHTRILHETKARYPGYAKLVDAVKALAKYHDFFKNEDWVDADDTSNTYLPSIARGLFLR